MNENYFYVAYSLVWAVLLLYLVRLHVMVRRLQREEPSSSISGNEPSED